MGRTFSLVHCRMSPTSSPGQYRMAWGWVGLFAMALTLSACATPISVIQVDSQTAQRALTRNVLSAGEPSPFSQIVLNRANVYEQFAENPEAAARMIVEQGLTVRDAEMLAAKPARAGSTRKPRPGKDADTIALEKALSEIPALREQFWADVRVSGQGEELNNELEKAGPVAD